MKNFPLISIVVPVYNRKETLSETLESVIVQSYNNWELLIIDDGSTDGSIEIIKQYAGQDDRINFYQRKRQPKGASTCRNIGIKEAKGDYVIFLDSDDLLAPQALEQRILIFKESPRLEMLVTPCLIFDDDISNASFLWNIEDTNFSDLERLLMLDMPWQTTSATWKAEIISRIGMWDESLPSFQDWELDIRAILLKTNYTKSGKPDCYWRKPSSVRKSIGNKSVSKNHLDSHFVLFLKVTEMFLHYDDKFEHKKPLLINLYFWWFNNYKKINKSIALKKFHLLLTALDLSSSKRSILMLSALFSLHLQLFRFKNILVKCFGYQEYLENPRPVTWQKFRYREKKVNEIKASKKFTEPTKIN